MAVFSYRVPKVPYAQKMKEKSNCKVLSVINEDPSTTAGMTNVAKSFLPYIPVTSDCGNIRAKTAIQGTHVYLY